MSSGKMIEFLKSVESRIPEYLDDKTIWRTRWIKPNRKGVKFKHTFERVYLPFKNFQFFINVMHPVENPEWHLHPRPAAFRVLSGKYKSTFSHYEVEREKREYSSKIIAPGQYYEMINPQLGHFVDVITDYTLSVSVIGEPYAKYNNRFKSLKYSGPPVEFIELSDKRKNEIIDMVISYYNHDK
ncbi:hypothetical protein M9194_18205 [Vibrio sp. S4M6]|uniref:hypothetical protein n=1 Tax=Vibrio sinus TaxID=2946865 RepID=UPI002029B5DE|nr:hypothetical protein [Vibrio sinus]MCL9783365.1 hypothetical protein [Vibrio sinus]